MDAPNWAEIKAADAAYVTMVATWVAAVATIGASALAFFAVKWAKRAADAAQRQIRIMEEQMLLSEPQPVVDVRIGRGEGGSPVVECENVGEALAFDLEFSDLIVSAGQPEYKILTLRLFKEPVLKPGDCKGLAFKVLGLQYGPLSREAVNLGLPTFFKEIEKELVSNMEEYWLRDERAVLRPLKITYQNARGRLFETNFLLGKRFGKTGLEIFPERSLLVNKANSELSDANSLA